VKSFRVAISSNRSVDAAINEINAFCFSIRPLLTLNINETDKVLRRLSGFKLKVNQDD